MSVERTFQQTSRIITMILLLGASTPAIASDLTSADGIRPRQLIGQWKVEDISGRSVVDNSITTIWFGDDGAINGSTGVNQFRSKAIIDGDEIALAPAIAMTRVVGSPALMNQETKFLAALSKARTFQIDNDMLSLFDDEGFVLLKASHVVTTFQLSTHVLDTSKGKPGVGVLVKLEKRDQTGNWAKIATSTTNDQGRIGSLLPSIEGANNHGTYRLTFALEDYFKASHQETVFPEAVVVFKIADDSHYHIPVVVTPYAISTYRGS